MTMDENEQVASEESLREDFRALRSDVETSGTLPDFSTMMAAAHAEIEEAAGRRPIHPGQARTSLRRTVWTHPGTWMSAAMAAAVAGILLVGSGQNTADDDFERLVAAYAADASLGAWRSPTDGLMRTPGVDLGAIPLTMPMVPGERPGPEGGRDS